MRYQLLSEPELLFCHGKHVCPRTGIQKYSVYDNELPTKKTELIFGVVGTAKLCASFTEWINRCKLEIPSNSAKLPNLNKPFCGFNKNAGYHTEFIILDANIKNILESEISEIIKIRNNNKRIEEASALYIEKIQFLAQNRHCDVIVCILPNELYDRVKSQTVIPREDEKAVTDSDDNNFETNFHSIIKAKSMKYGVPTQIVIENTLQKNPKGKENDALRAWDFCTAQYYKASNQSIPWRLPKEINVPETCYVGISFYRSRDKKAVLSSLAQVFDEMGKNVIIRGMPVKINKQNPIPHLSENQSYELFKEAIRQYSLAMEGTPKRIVIHKTSAFSDEEDAGFTYALEDMNIRRRDFVVVLDSDIRLYRKRNYPPYRGSLVELDVDTSLLYTRGSVPYYQTYYGKYIPQPLEIRFYKTESSNLQITSEILALTKMNWNNTQFDRKYPVTIECARNVGRIIKYIDEEETPQTNYRFYM